MGGEGRAPVDPDVVRALWRRAVHDVRGPLAVVLGQTELLLEEACGPLTGEQRAALLKVQRNGDAIAERLREGTASLWDALGRDRTENACDNPERR